jgi:hypothetical protein
MTAHAINGMPVLLSFATWSPWIAQYVPTFDHLMIDSGAFSELNSGVAIDIGAYRDWSEPFHSSMAPVAGLDDISGDWQRSLKNYAEIPWSFPTFHDTDPPELLDDLIAMATERKTWLGIGLLPPRSGRETFLRRTLDQIPDGLHVHLWAGRAYTYLRRIDSVDSTNWFRDAMLLRERGGLGFLSYAECVDIIVKRYQRAVSAKKPEQGDQLEFG